MLDQMPRVIEAITACKNDVGIPHKADLSWNYLMKPEETVVTKLSDEAQLEIDRTMQLIKER